SEPAASRTSDPRASAHSIVRQFPVRFCCSVGRAASPVFGHPVLLPRWRAESPFPLLHRCRRPPDARARSSGPSSFASSSTSLHAPPPGWPYPAQVSATCIPPPPVGTNPAAIRNCAAAESSRNPSGPFFCRALVPAPTVVCPLTALANLALPTPRVVESSTPRCSPSPPTPPIAISSTPPCASVPPSSPRSWRFLDRSHPGSERIPSAARSPDRSRPRSVESPVNPGAVFGCLQSFLPRVFLPSLYPTLLSTPAQAGRWWILI